MLRTRWASAGAALAVCLGTLLVLPGAPEARGLIAGVAGATTFWLAALRPAPARPLRAPARTLSRELLDGVPGWRTVHDVPLADGAVDHVVVTPLAVLAVTTGPATALGCERARRSAGVLKEELGLALPVWPVVLTWGAGGATQLGPVDVVAGEDASAWIDAYRTGAIPPAVTEQVHAALLRHRRRRDTHRLAA